MSCKNIVKWWSKNINSLPINGGWYKFKAGSLQCVWDKYNSDPEKWQLHYYNNGTVHYKYFGEQDFVYHTCIENGVTITQMPGQWVVDYPDVPLPNYRQANQQKIPDLVSCVYFLWRGQHCMYVGQTKNLRKRLTHHKKYFKGDVVTWIPFRWNELLRAEGFYIWLLHPPRNNRHICTPNDDHEPRAFPMRTPRATFLPKRSENFSKRL